MSEPTTIRELLEAIKRFNDPVVRGWTSDNYTYAVAALALLPKVEERITFILDRTVGEDFSAADDALSMLLPDHRRAL